MTDELKRLYNLTLTEDELIALNALMSIGTAQATHDIGTQLIVVLQLHRDIARLGESVFKEVTLKMHKLLASCPNIEKVTLDG